MRYLGSKVSIKKELIPIIAEHLNGDNEFVDAFMGGAMLLMSKYTRILTKKWKNYSLIVVYNVCDTFFIFLFYL